MPSVIVVGAGLAGLATATALADAGFDVEVLEARPFPGGRATSYPVPRPDGSSVVLDNCQHILLRCCVNLLDFYRRLGVSDRVEFHREFYWVEPGGRTSVFRAGSLPPPAHFAVSFLKLKFLTASEKVAVGKAMTAIARERRSVIDLDGMSMLQWLQEHGQPARAIERFWRQVLVSAVNEELQDMSAFHGLQVFRLGFLTSRDAYEMGVPSVGLAELLERLQLVDSSKLRLRFRVSAAAVGSVCELTNGSACSADFYIVAVPFDKVGSLVPGYEAPSLKHSPITGVHLWFDRSVMDLPHATLLERNIQWVFNKGAGRQLQLVISASRSLTQMTKPEVVELCRKELADFFPCVNEAKLLHAHVVKEVRATISAQPGVAARRPGVHTGTPNIFVAGDWTWTGWPSTMEGAVRSGYAAAEAVCHAAGRPDRFLLDDIA